MCRKVTRAKSVGHLGLYRCRNVGGGLDTSLRIGQGCKPPPPFFFLSIRLAPGKILHRSVACEGGEPHTLLNGLSVGDPFSTEYNFPLGGFTPQVLRYPEESGVDTQNTSCRCLMHNISIRLSRTPITGNLEALEGVDGCCQREDYVSRHIPPRVLPRAGPIATLCVAQREHATRFGFPPKDDDTK